MRIDYVDRPEQSDPAKHTRYLVVYFDKDEEVAALNRRGTYKYILAYTRFAMEIFLGVNAYDYS